MPIPCATCREQKTKIYFDQERALETAKKLAIEKEETYCIYRKGGAIAYASAATALAGGYDIISLVSKHI